MSTSSDGVLKFLAAVHDADERAARDARSGPWRARPDGFHAGVWLESNEPVAPYGMGEEDAATGAPWYQIPARPHVAIHIARHDPQSVLARIDGERLILRMHWNDDGWCPRCDPRDDTVPIPCPTVCALAWGYRGREGFDPAWTPDGVEVGA